MDVLYMLCVACAGNWQVASLSVNTHIICIQVTTYTVLYVIMYTVQYVFMLRLDALLCVCQQAAVYAMCVYLEPPPPVSAGVGQIVLQVAAKVGCKCYGLEKADIPAKFARVIKSSTSHSVSFV